MKNILLTLTIALATVLASCGKEELPAPSAPAGNTQNQSIAVEYKVRATSANVTVQYMAPNSSGELELTTVQASRVDNSFSFDFERGHIFSVKAQNTFHSADEVIVEIYVNGVLQKTASANTPGAVAYAEVKID